MNPVWKAVDQWVALPAHNVDTAWARYTLTLPCAHCGAWTTLYTNSRDELVLVAQNGRLCQDCYARQEATR